MLAGQLGQNETQRTLIQTASLGSSLSVIPSSYHNHIYGDMIHIISVVITLFLEQVFHVNSFKAVECDIKSFSWICWVWIAFQLKTVFMPKGPLWGLPTLPWPLRCWGRKNSEPHSTHTIAEKQMEITLYPGKRRAEQWWEVRKAGKVASGVICRGIRRQKVTLTSMQLGNYSFAVRSTVGMADDGKEDSS